MRPLARLGIVVLLAASLFVGSVAKAPGIKAAACNNVQFLVGQTLTIWNPTLQMYDDLYVDLYAQNEGSVYWWRCYSIHVRSADNTPVLVYGALREWVGGQFQGTQYATFSNIGVPNSDAIWTGPEFNYACGALCGCPDGVYGYQADNYGGSGTARTEVDMYSTYLGYWVPVADSSSPAQGTYSHIDQC